MKIDRRKEHGLNSFDYWESETKKKQTLPQSKVYLLINISSPNCEQIRK